jgi:hypothetical protein
MQSIQAATWSNTIDRDTVPLIDRRSDTGQRERSAQTYRGAIEAAHESAEVKLSNATVTLELSGLDRRVEAFADYRDTDLASSVQVRLVDSVTTRTLRELTVGQTHGSQRLNDDYGYLLHQSVRSRLS